MSLRTRLIAVLAALVVSGLVVSGIATYSALKTFLFKRVDQQLRAAEPIAVSVLAASLRGDPNLENESRNLPIAAYAELRDPSGAVVGRRPFGFKGGNPPFHPALPAKVGASSVSEPFTVGSTDNSSYRFRVLATPTNGGGMLIVAIPLADAEQTLQHLLWVQLIVALFVLAAIAVVAWFLVRRELRPLDRMTEAATEIAGGDLARRVDAPDARTEVGRLGHALNRMLEQIEQAFAARRASEERMRQFLADASHELRTPLTSIRGYAELFRRGAERRPEDLRLSMRRIEDDAARMGVLVEDLLLLARVDHTRPLASSPVDLTSLVYDVATDGRARAPDRRIEVKADGAAIVRGDEDRLRQAVINLLSNAIIHTPAGSPIQLGVHSQGGWATVTVMDWGQGLEPEALEHAFDRFWRADPSRSRASGGVGLGLAIVDAIARAHGGEVVARNAEGGAGALFSLRIPTADSQQTLSSSMELSKVEPPDSFVSPRAGRQEEAQADPDEQTISSY